LVFSGNPKLPGLQAAHIHLFRARWMIWKSWFILARARSSFGTSAFLWITTGKIFVVTGSFLRPSWRPLIGAISGIYPFLQKFFLRFKR
jgi:O-antigen ligase